MDFEVRRTDLAQHRIVDDPVPAAAPGQAVLHVDHAALTANNITYGVFGEAMGYWNFFPVELPPGSQGPSSGWGRIPVWGFADVVESRVDDIADGERVYGYFPMSTHLVVEPSQVTATSFTDAAAHRAPMSPVYNQYVRLTDREPAHDEHIRAVLRPLFTTSFLIDDWLADADSFGATSVVIASASSKTALALAALLSSTRDLHVVGLTSARNAEFVRSVGYYDSVVVYGDVSTLDASTPTVLVDMGGDANVIAAIHNHFGDSLLHSCQVGATHWTEVRFDLSLPGPKPTMFFAPDQVRRRIADWGGQGFDERVTAAWDLFTASAAAWIDIVVHRGPAAVTEAFTAVLEGRVPANQAFVISLDP